MNLFVKSLVFTLLIHLTFSLYGQNPSDEIVRSYALRMDGRIEASINSLSKIIETDSTNAMAHFEMARAIEDQKKSYHIEKALLYEPDNLKYRFYKANLQMLEAYKAMKTNNMELISKNLDQCTETLKGILAIQPDCKESLLFLIDIYGSLPEDMGGNMAMAETYLKTLESVDPFYAAQGQLILELKDHNVDLVAYWKNYMTSGDDSNDALIKLGHAYLMNNNIEMAKETFNRVIKNDPEQTILLLDVARAHLYTAMRGGDNVDEALNKFKKHINLYLETALNKPRLIEAWCYGWLGMVEAKQGNGTAADKYVAKAEKLIPDYPRFTAIPTIDQPPNKMFYRYKSYFSPF
ncbi:tetratricopeptide repeat protein [Aestuariivivens sediminicola]|uniref:tetratricopeptide repeat protein n=1 Tax=Aestuariivivens sediminicola TaxID=2913560 RepID=UPI001F57D867|nr:tetratricopeptide repeat protein [Aestuariivivens sediminicola]